MPCARENTFYRYTIFCIVVDLVFHDDVGIDICGEKIVFKELLLLTIKFIYRILSVITYELN